MAFLRAWLQEHPELYQMERRFSLEQGAEKLVAEYDAALAVLESGDVGAWMSDASATAGLSDSSIAHFNDDWLGGTTFAETETDHVVDRIRDGFRDALTDARERMLPTTILWTSFEMNDPSFFDVGHMVGANAVTVVIASARPPAPAS